MRSAGSARLSRRRSAPVRAAPAAEVKALAERASAQLTATFPAAWRQRTDDADLDLVDLTLDRLDAAVSSGQWRLAEQARLEAYAFIEFGPELKLRSFDPGLAFDIEGLVWFGARGERGLAQLIARHAPRDQFRATRLALDDSLRNARATLGEESAGSRSSRTRRSSCSARGSRRC
jgi:high-affinity iron transporter